MLNALCFQAAEEALSSEELVLMITCPIRHTRSLLQRIANVEAEIMHGRRMEKEVQGTGEGRLRTVTFGE